MSGRSIPLGGALLAAAGGLVGLWYASQALRETEPESGRAGAQSRAAPAPTPPPVPDAALIDRLRREAERREAAQREAECQEAERRERFGPDIAGLVAVGKSAQSLYEYDKDLGGGVKLRLVLIPEGTFMMGSPENEPGRDGDEGPRHRVTLKSFLIGKYEVTQRQWQAVMGNNPSHFKNAGLDAPVEQVSWDACKHFCEKTGLRLPSEAEWEYACRAGTTTAIYTGALTIKGERNGPELDDIAWYSGNSGVTYEGGYDSSAWIERQHNHTRSGTHPVGQKKPNAWGLHDTLGNVWEWCEDTLYASYNGAPTDGSAWISNESGYRVVRGGSWYDYARNLRAADRPGGAPGYRYYSSGFRASASVSPR